MTEIAGWTAPGFEGVRDAFAANFAADREVGAGFAAYHHGQKVADLWGGVADADTGEAWTEDTRRGTAVPRLVVDHRGD